MLFVAALVVTTACGGVLRFWDIGRDSLWEDEAASVFYARLPLGVLLGSNVDPGNPPGYRIALKGWVALFGEGEAALRSLSALAGMLGVVAVGVLGRLWSGSVGVGLLAALLLAISPYHIYYSREARGYALCVLLGLLSSALLLALLRRPRWVTGAGYALLAGAAPYVHYQGLVLLGAQWCGAGAWWWFAGRERRTGWAALSVCLASAGLVAPCVAMYVLPGLLAPGGYSFWQGPATWRGVAAMLAEWALDRKAAAEIPDSLPVFGVVTVSAALALPGLLAVTIMRDRRPWAACYVAMMYAGVLGFVALTLWKEAWQAKYLSVFQPLYLLGLCCVARLGPGVNRAAAWRGVLAGVVVVALAAAFGVRGYRHERAWPWKPDYRAAAAELRRIDPGGGVPVVVHRAAFLPIAYYFCPEGVATAPWVLLRSSGGLPGEGAVLKAMVEGGCPRIRTTVDSEEFLSEVESALWASGEVLAVSSETQSGSEWPTLTARLRDAGRHRANANAAWRVHVAHIER